MARVDEFLNNGRTDKAGTTGDENTHYDFSFTSFHDHDRISRPGYYQDGDGGNTI
jgi:hypothetical protein